MNIAFFQFASSSIHFAASLEILRKEFESGNSGYYCYWGSSTSFPGRMSKNYESIIRRVPRKVKQLVTLADPKILLSSKMKFNADWVNGALSNLMLQIEKISSIRDLDRLNFEGIAPGGALANEITTLTKSRDFDFKVNMPLVEKLLRSYLEVFSAVKTYSETNQIKRIYVFNGRFLHERAVWDSSLNAGIQCVLFETMRDRYLQREKGFHDRVNNQVEMLDLWKHSHLPELERISIGSQYFQQLRSRSNPFATSGHLDLETGKPYFVYFSNSDDEAVGFWDSWNETFGSQITAVRELQRLFDEVNDKHLIIRLHPNLKNKSTKQKEDWLKISSTHNSTVINYNSPISSYKLLDESLGSITFGSTMGLESAFASKPTLLLADSGYDLLDVADKPTDWSEVIAWINEGFKLEESEILKRKRNSCLRGFFLAKGGTSFQYSDLREIGWGAWEVDRFDNLRVKSNRIVNFYSRTVSKLKFFKIRKLLQNE